MSDGECCSDEEFEEWFDDEDDVSSDNEAPPAQGEVYMYKPIAMHEVDKRLKLKVPSAPHISMSTTTIPTPSQEMTSPTFFRRAKRTAKRALEEEPPQKAVKFNEEATKDVCAPKCPEIRIRYPQVLMLARQAWTSRLPPPRFMKRMKVGESCHASLSQFIVHKVEKVKEVAGKPAVITEDDDATYGEDHICEQCNAIKVLDARTAQSICIKCGETSTYNVPDTSFREGVQIHQSYLYKKSNHFRDHLRRVQGRESTHIDAEVIAAIRAELSKTYSSDASLKSVSTTDIRRILKKLGKATLYNHSTRIWSLVTGGRPPVLTTTQEEELMHLFSLIQDPWTKVKPKNRSNMLSYSYLIHKMALLLDYPEIAQHFKLLKSKEKRVYQDKLWSAVCKELDIRFDRSV